MRCQDLIDKLKQENQDLITQVEEQLRPMDAKQWAWRVKSNGWNALETMEHLNRMFDRAFPKINLTIDKALEEGHSPTETYQVGWIGEVAVQLIDNSEERKNYLKFKTPTSFNPLDQPLEVEKVLGAFLAQLQEYDRMLERSRLVPLGKVRVRFTSGSFVRFRLGDTLRFISAHTSRHVLQIKRLLNHEQFPKSIGA
ncbi:MAG TPA: hypothetical protein DCE41_13685 [Cytophagales bacterium]|nr:hypothetical protein [Cytophagales bacterium]HAA22714.1 hypothetical protein [Cytophagales bacterium]HAP58670.1 hypothetical protein [Cytophagales bacterium]